MVLEGIAGLSCIDRTRDGATQRGAHISYGNGITLLALMSRTAGAPSVRLLENNPEIWAVVRLKTRPGESGDMADGTVC